MRALVNLNGKIFPAQEAKVSVFDRGFLFGDGVYETGRSYDRCFLYLEEHWARLRRSAEKLRLPVPWSDVELKEKLFETARAFGEDNVYFRVIVTRGEISHVGLDVFEESTPTLVLLIQELSELDKLRSRGVKLLTSNVVRNSAASLDPNIKASNYLNSLLAIQDVRARGAEDAILCDAQGRVAEGTTFSVFGVQSDGTLITPSLEIGILDSITRRHVLKAGHLLGKTAEGAYSLDTFLKCAEIFIASSVREIVPVREWDGRGFPVPGTKTKLIHEKLRADIREYIRSHETY